MTGKRKPLPLRVRQAHAYYRLAAKAAKAAQYAQAEHWRNVADRIMAEHRREQDAQNRRRS